MKTLLNLFEYKSGLKGKDIAALWGITPTHYSRLKKGRSKEFLRLVEFAEEYGITADEVWDALTRDYSPNGS